MSSILDLCKDKISSFVKDNNLTSRKILVFTLGLIAIPISAYLIYSELEKKKLKGKVISPPLTTDNKIHLFDGIYTGQLTNDIPHGEGTLEYTDGSKYVGQFFNGEITGDGTIYYSNRDQYKGQFQNGKAHGIGQYFSYEKKIIYSGEWNNELQDGYGSEIKLLEPIDYDNPFTNNQLYECKYEGEYKNGKKNGIGKLIWKSDNFEQDNISVYNGSFCDNNMSGHGEYTWSDKRRYVGQWSDNQLNGNGEYYWPNGNKYIGQYQNDKRHGHGVFEWSNGAIYDGYWSNGAQHGEGKYKKNRHNKWKMGKWESGLLIPNFD